MSDSNIYHINSLKQDRQEAKFTMQGIALTNLIHRIIREYGKYDGVDYSVDTSSLDLTDRKLLISHVCDVSDYARACEFPFFLENVWDEFEPHIQTMIDAECSQVYRDDMEEMGMCASRNILNNEITWARR